MSRTRDVLDDTVLTAVEFAPTGPGQPWWGGISPDPKHWSNNIILCSVGYSTSAATARKKGEKADG